MQRILIVTLLALATTLAGSGNAYGNQQVFRWVDENGVVHFGDRPPENVEAIPVRVRPNTVSTVPAKKPAPEPADDSAADPAAPATGPGTETAELSVAEQRRQERQSKRREQAEKDRITAQNCALWREQKARIEPNPRILVDDGSGGVRRMEDQERLGLLEEANAFLAENCD
jgi:hypothetical protein